MGASCFLPCARDCGRMLARLGAVVLLVGVLGQSPSGNQSKCCFDKQWSAIISEVGGYFNPDGEKLIDGTTFIAYDFYSSRQSTVSYIRGPNNTYIPVRELRDYARNIHYKKTGNGTCTQSPFLRGRMWPPCIPANAVSVTQAQLGYGQSNLPLHFWEFDVDGPGGSTAGRIKLGVTINNCIPVVEIFTFNINGTMVEMNVVFSEYRPGVADEHAFDIPDTC